MVAPSKRVLVVDDEAIVRSSYNRVLTDAGYAVKPVPGGREALAACRAEPFDAMVADLRMPDMDGMAVARTVRQEFPHMPVIIATGYPTSDSAAEAQKLGIFDYLQKPVAPDRLSAATAAALAWPMGRIAPEVFTPTVAPAVEETHERAVEPIVAASTAPAVAPVVAPAVEPAVEAETKQMGAVHTLGLLALAPIMGLAYVVFLPLLGFGMLFALLGHAAARRLRRENAERSGKASA